MIFPIRALMTPQEESAAAFAAEKRFASERESFPADSGTSCTIQEVWMVRHDR
jgi:hypothetical protein